MESAEKPDINIVEKNVIEKTDDNIDEKKIKVKTEKPQKFDDTPIKIGRYKDKGITLGHIRINRPEYYQYMMEVGFVNATTGEFSEKRVYENIFDFDLTD